MTTTQNTEKAVDQANVAAFHFAKLVNALHAKATDAGLDEATAVEFTRAALLDLASKS